MNKLISVAVYKIDIVTTKWDPKSSSPHCRLIGIIITTDQREQLLMIRKKSIPRINFICLISTELTELPSQVLRVVYIPVSLFLHCMFHMR